MREHRRRHPTTRISRPPAASTSAMIAAVADPLDPTSDERARLVGAAWVVLERAGYEGFKVQLLLRETGLSARTFYRHFEDKDELLLALMADEYARAATRIRAALARADGPDAKVAAWIDEIVQAAGDPKRSARARLFTSQPAVLRRYPDELSSGGPIDPRSPPRRHPRGTNHRRLAVGRPRAGSVAGPSPGRGGDGLRPC